MLQNGGRHENTWVEGRREVLSWECSESKAESGRNEDRKQAKNRHHGSGEDGLGFVLFCCFCFK